MPSDFGIFRKLVLGAVLFNFGLFLKAVINSVWITIRKDSDISEALVEEDKNTNYMNRSQN